MQVSFFNRPWLMPVAGSIALHAGLALLPLVFDGKPGEEPVRPVVRLQQMPVQPEPEPEPVPDARALAEVAPQPQTAPVSPPDHVAEPEPEPVVELEPESRMEVAALAETRELRHDSSSWLDGYVTAMHRSVYSQQRYPWQARRMGIEGTAVVRIRLAADGTLAAPLLIEQSSGSEHLDREALRMVEQAAPFAGFPYGARQDVEFVLPVYFSLGG